MAVDAWVWLRALALEGVRWWRGVPEGIEKPTPGNIESWAGSAPEVEDVLDTTDAFWAARRRASSRVSRFTCFRLAI
jgi:hypothetical protein